MQRLTVSHQACASALCGTGARALSCHYEGSRGKREAKWFPGFTLMWNGWGGVCLVTGSGTSGRPEWKRRQYRSRWHDTGADRLYVAQVRHACECSKLWLGTWAYMPIVVYNSWTLFSFQITTHVSVFHLLFLGRQPEAAIRTMRIVMSWRPPNNSMSYTRGWYPYCGVGNGCRLGRKMTQFPISIVSQTKLQQESSSSVTIMLYQQHYILQFYCRLWPQISLKDD